MTTWAPLRNGLTGWHVLAVFTAFFGMVFTMSGIFVWLALTTFPGNDPAAYRHGLHYNRTLAEAERQDRLGWRLSGGYDAVSGRLVVTLRDAEERPLSGEQVQAVIGRPATSKFDREASLYEEKAGIYAVPLRLESGSWNVKVRVNPNGTGTPFNTSLRVWSGATP